MILITCAAGKELAFLPPAPHVELLVTGIGPVEAAASVSRALAQSPYELVINAGLAGALGDAAEIGEGVVIADERLELMRETGTPLALPEGTSIIDRVFSDLTLVDRLVELGFRSMHGITVTHVTATDASAARLAAIGCSAETMEGFAVLRAAEIAGVPAVEVRGISNVAGDQTRGRWDFTAGVSGVERILTALLTMLKRNDG